MKYQELEPIEVIAYFKGLDIKVLKFRRKGSSVYRVTEMASKWKRREGENITTHFIVRCREEKVTCEISFSHTDWKWELVQFDNLD